MKPRNILRVTWRAMLSRCENRRDGNYESYGGRGIRVCERWHTFQFFAEDMGPRTSVEFSIDRIDNDGNYEPGNCRWATRAEQSRNKRTSRVLELDGQRKCLVDWARDSGVSVPTLIDRLKAEPLSRASLRRAESYRRPDRLPFAGQYPFPDHPDLSIRMLQVLLIVRKHISQHGCSPPAMTIAETLGVRGSVGPIRHVQALVAAGYLESTGASKGRRLTVVERSVPDLPSHAAIASAPTPCGPACPCRDRGERRTA